MTDKSFAIEVVETSTTTGPGTYSLGGIPAGSAYRTFRQEYSNGNTKTVFTVRNAGNTKWEENEFGTLTYSTPDTLTRNVKRSTNGDAAISWVSGDLPLTIYVSASQDVQEGAVTQWLAVARNTIIRFGMWWKDATPAASYQQLNHYDGTNDIPIGIANQIEHDVTLYGTPRSYLSGLTTGPNVSTPTTKISITAGEAMDSTNVISIKLGGGGITKRTGGAWAVGDDANGMGNGLTIGNNTIYHIFAIINAGIVDAYFDTSVTAANKPTGTSYFRRIGSFLTDGSAHIINYVQDGDLFQWASPVEDINVNSMGTSAITRTLSVPLGVNVQALVILTLSNTSAVTNASAYLSDLATTDLALSETGLVGLAANSVATWRSRSVVRTNTSSQIRTRVFGIGDAGVTLIITTLGWIDRRGRDA